MPNLHEQTQKQIQGQIDTWFSRMENRDFAACPVCKTNDWGPPEIIVFLREQTIKPLPRAIYQVCNHCHYGRILSEHILMAAD